jgi:hypothetical protein
MLIVIRTGKAFRRPKYKPQAKHDQWGVYKKGRNSHEKHTKDQP